MAKGFVEALDGLQRNGLLLTEIARHPITLAWLSKLVSLTGSAEMTFGPPEERFDDPIMSASSDPFYWCQKKAKEQP